MTDTLEQTAQRIAERGRDALLARLRPAFQEAAREHADVLALDDEQLEQMVQRAADRADGLQWRRALAGVASEELEIGLGEALSHPAVVRAQSLVGAPSYEESLAALEPEGPEPTAAPEPAADGDETAADDTAEVAAAAGEQAEEEDYAAYTEEEYAEEEESPSLELPAVHVGGIANLEASEQGIELRLSEDGLDIARGRDEVLGRLRWREIRALEVPAARGLRRRRRGGRPQLVIRTEHGDATFEIPDVSAEELEARLRPLRQRYAPRLRSRSR